MTVGIAAIAENDGSPSAIVSADRMITIGQGDGVEYEDTGSKLETFIHQDQLCAVAVGSGPSNYLDEVFRTIHSVVANQPYPPTTMEGAMNCCLGASQVVVRDSLTNQVLSPLGYTLADFQDKLSGIARVRPIRRRLSCGLSQCLLLGDGR